ncbi:MAG TPA: FAD-dependent monooxygenase [Microlunatus sp.]
MKIICVGGGPAGLYAALLLKRADPRREVQVFERDAEDTVRGWGVTFWDDLLAEMHDHDAESAKNVAAVAARWTGLEVQVQGRPPAVDPEFWGHSIARSSLIGVLTERARSLGVQITYGSEKAPDDVAEEADLVVAADGAGSRFRQAHAIELGTAIDHGRNRFVWLATPRVFPAFRFAFARPTRLPPGSDWLCCYAYAFSDTASTFVVELPAETLARLGLDGLSADASMALLQEAFADQLDGQPLVVQPTTEGTVPWTSFPTVRNRVWHVGNVALMGDAAHTTHYSIGFGTKLALEDAMGLSRAIHEESGVPAALRRYERERRRATAPVQRDAHFSQRWFEQAQRYLAYDGEEFATLLNRRRSPWLGRIPPAALIAARRLVKRGRGQ